jgi:SAM-dependent methyltransferase
MYTCALTGSCRRPSLTSSYRGQSCLRLDVADRAGCLISPSVSALEFQASTTPRLRCKQAEAILAKSGIRGAISHADIFDPPGDLLGRFDVVVSFGVVEHFDRPSDCVAMMARFGRPGATLLTLVPNLAGMAGIMQKYLCRRIYDIHVVLDRDALSAIHRDAGLEVRSCEYFMGVNWAVVNLSCLPRYFQSLAVGVQLGLSAPFWLIERMGMSLPPNRVTSPYVVCVASTAGG